MHPVPSPVTGETLVPTVTHTIQCSQCTQHQCSQCSQQSSGPSGFSVPISTVSSVPSAYSGTDVLTVVLVPPAVPRAPSVPRTPSKPKALSVPITPSSPSSPSAPSKPFAPSKPSVPSILSVPSAPQESLVPPASSSACPVPGAQPEDPSPSLGSRANEEHIHWRISILLLLPCTQPPWPAAAPNGRDTGG